MWLPGLALHQLSCEMSRRSIPSLGLFPEGPEQAGRGRGRVGAASRRTVADRLGCLQALMLRGA